MRYLLDTHVIIWYFDDSPKLPQKIAEIIDNPKNKVCISSASLWEITLKMNIGKLDIDFTLDELLNAIKDNDFDVLQIEDRYLQGLSTLPFIHKDPFDRLLIATAKAERMSILTADENIQRYDVQWIW
ncbi:MAG: type II toxin-antitoxin system VapC family toxin [Oscillospiraceae bacterium]|nr:type II toxin-antitoxin system VapC family toxin [Oscillospiraceae bacterium]